MKLLRPIEVDDDILAASSVPEAETTWSSATTYALGAVVRGTAGLAHRTFESQQASNLNHPLTDPAWWLETGATNRWKMFDGSVESQTVQAASLQVELLPETRVDSVACFNVDAASAQITMVHPDDGVVYNRSVNLVVVSGIEDFYDYFVEPRERKTEFVVTDMPPFFGATVSIQLLDPEGVAKCGACVPGLSRWIGGTKWGLTLGLKDYSQRVVDAFGNSSIAKRAFSRLGRFMVIVGTDFVDRLQNLLAEYRSTAIVFIGAEAFGSTLLYGFYDEAETELAYPDVSYLSLNIVSLT